MFLFNFNKDIFNELKIMLCALPEKKLKLNVNALNSLQGQLLVSLLPKVINEEHALKTIISKPTYGWHNIQKFTDFLLSGLSLTQDELVSYKKVIEPILTVEESYIHAIFWIKNNEQYYKMKSILELTPQSIDVIQRQYSISE